MIDEIYKSIRFALKDMIIFPGKNLKNVLHYSIMISVISTICHFFTPITFLNYIGAWLGVLVLTLAYFIGGAKDVNRETDFDGPLEDNVRDDVLQEAGSSDAEPRS